jgi:AraC-like DNA-binding protein
MEFLPNSRIFQTSDVDEAEAFTSRLWDSYKISIIEGPFGLCWNQAKLGGAHFSYVEHNCATKIKGGESRSDSFRLILPQTGALRNRLDGVVAEAGKMVFTCYAPELELDIDNCKLLLVNLNPSAVWSALGQRFQKLPPIQGWHSTPASSAAVQTLRSMAMWLGAEVDRPGSPLASPGKARLHAERLLLSLFTECMAQVVLYETDSIPGVSERHVRRAEEWIDAHLTEVIGVEDVAAALDVGVRSLQISFQRVRGYSPLESIRRRRLEHTRKALLQAEPGATVTTIATQFGFFELGRFSKRYRKTFGEAPSETLARRLGSCDA